MLVVGAGPVGLTLALGLARCGVACRVIDRSPGPTTISRATELHARSLELFDSFGLAQEFLTAGLVLSEVPFFHEGRPVARLRVEGIDSPFPAKLGLPQRDTERILLEHLEASGVRVQRGWELVTFQDRGDAVAATLRDPAGREEEIRAGWLVGCDGFHSAVRTAADIPFEGEDYPGLWAIVDARLEGWPYAADQIPVFLGEDGFWAMPLPGGWIRLYFRHTDATPLPGPEEVSRVLARYVPGTTRVRELTAPATFRIHFRVAQRFRAGRVFLAGDAAHVCSPVGGEGMNTGIQDAANLAWKLALASGGHGGEILLDSYDAERRAVDAAAARASDEGQRGSLVTGAEEQAARDRALAAQFCSPAAQIIAAETNADLRVNYRHSPAVGGDVPDGASGPVPGDRIPDAGPLRPLGGGQVRLRDVLRGYRHTLVLFPCAAERAGVEEAARAAALAARGLGPRVRRVVLVPSEEAPALSVPGVEILADPELAVHGRLGVVRPTLVLVRPDGYLAYRREPPDAARLAAFLARAYGGGAA